MSHNTAGLIKKLNMLVIGCRLTHPDGHILNQLANLNLPALLAPAVSI